MQHSLPVADVLLAQRRVEAISMARRGDVSGGRAFAEHLLDGISGHEMNQQEDEAHDQPNYRQGVEHALEEAGGHRLLVLSSRFSVTNTKSIVILSEASSHEFA